MTTLSEMWATENALHILNRSDAKVERGEPYTKEQAVDALYWHVGEVIQHIAEEHILDASELRAAIWRRMTLDMAQSRAKLTDLFADFVHVLKARSS